MFVFRIDILIFLLNKQRRYLITCGNIVVKNRVNYEGSIKNKKII